MQIETTEPHRPERCGNSPASASSPSGGDGAGSATRSRGWELACCLTLPQAVGAASALAAGRDVPQFYRGLRKPSWAPPPSVFGPAWTLLYGLMGLASWIVLGKKRDQKVTAALSLYTVQLALNGLWTPLFFRARRPDLALVEIMVLWPFIVLTMRRFARISRPAALLLLPYLAWTTFAAALNLELWRHNREPAPRKNGAP